MSEEEAYDHAQKCQQSIEALHIEHATSTCHSFATISMGLITQTGGNKMAPESLIKKADEALYKAKEAGRNQLQVYSE